MNSNSYELFKKLLKARFPTIRPDQIDGIVEAVSQGQALIPKLSEILNHPDLNDEHSVAVATAIVIVGARIFARAGSTHPDALSLMRFLLDAVMSFGFGVQSKGIEQIKKELAEALPEIQEKAEEILREAREEAADRDWTIH